MTGPELSLLGLAVTQDLTPLSLPLYSKEWNNLELLALLSQMVCVKWSEGGSFYSFQGRFKVACRLNQAWHPRSCVHEKAGHQRWRWGPIGLQIVPFGTAFLVCGPDHFLKSVVYDFQ